MKKIYLLITLFTIHCSLFTAKAQQGQWTWMNGSDLTDQLPVYGTQGMFAVGNTPPPVFEACFWTDLQGNFWMFGGGNGSQDTFYSDLWEFKPALNEWAWIKGPGIINQSGTYGTILVSNAANNPGGRQSNPTWVDTAGNLWLFGGTGYAAANSQGYLNDVWMYNIALNEWTWMAGPNTANDGGTYGTLLTPAPANNPSSREETNAAWTDANNNLWLFGGIDNGGYKSDMWMFNTTLNEWAWMNGPQAINQPGNWGTIDVPNAANIPSSRMINSKWKDSNGNFWMWGGEDDNGDLNDMWEFNPTTNIFTWMNGPNVEWDPGNVGSQCVPDIGNVPSSRYDNWACYTRNCNNFEFFGGFDELNGDYNDLWNYNISTNQWTWMSGNTNPNQTGSYGAIHVSNATNVPPSRQGSIGWTDTSGNLWMFGGMIGAALLNDMWRFVPDSICPNLHTDTVTSGFTYSPISSCGPSIVTFTNTSVNALNYIWDFGDTTTGNPVNPTHTYTYPGTYTIKLFASNPCGIHVDSAIHTFTVKPIPVPFILGDSVFCNGSSSVLNAGTFISYLWSTGNTTQTITVTTSNTYTITVTNAEGCTGTSSKVITVNNTPPPTLPSIDSLCTGTSKILNPGNYTQYLWSNGVTTQTNIIDTVGVYSVTVGDNNGCTQSATDSIYSIPSPSTTITSNGPDTFCSGGSVTLSAGVFPTYAWSTGATTQTITVTTSGDYIVTVIAANNCTANASQIVVVIQSNLVNTGFYSDTTKGCSPLTIQFIDTTKNALSYLWNFGDNSSTDTAKNPLHTYIDSGVYTITLIATDTGACGVGADTLIRTDYILVDVIHPVAAFTSNYLIPIYVGDSIHFQDESYDPSLLGITYWQWTFGDGTGSNFINPIHQWNLAGMYQVKLVVTNKAGCMDSTIYDYIDVIEGIIEIPNIFTPNNDGYNDFFEINTSGMQVYNFEIFNRWGMLQFQTNGNQIYWDGYNQNGIQCPEGTYYYTLKATGYSGKDYSRSGFIMILR